MLHQDNKKRLPPSSPEFIEALTLGNSSCRDIFTTVTGGGDVDFFFAGQPKPSPLSVGKQQRPCHLRSPAYKAYALLRFVAQNLLDLRMIGKFRVNSYDWEEISESTRKSI